MIRYTQGNLLEAPAEALVNTVNEVGVMGKGIALMFREAFPVNTRVYEDCRQSRTCASWPAGGDREESRTCRAQMDHQLPHEEALAPAVETEVGA